MVSRQQSADRFAHDVMERMRGVSLTPAAARQIKSAIDVRTTASDGPVQDVMDVLRGQRLEQEEARAITRFVASITDLSASANTGHPDDDRERYNQRGDYPRPVVPSFTDAERDAGRTPGDTERPRYRRLGDNPQA